MNQQQSQVIEFSKIKDKLMKALEEKLKSGKLHISESVTIIDGFVNQPLSMEIPGPFVIGGPSVPLIMLVGNDSGRVYFLALKAIIPDREE